MKDLSAAVTVFVLTVGDEANYNECIECLKKQNVTFLLETVRGVAPLGAALQQMIDHCTTPYYIQLDDDMHLYPDAVGRLYERITSSEKRRVAGYCAPLWDKDVEREILGIKIYRHEITKSYPYRDVYLCAVEQSERYAKDGFILQSEVPTGNSYGVHGALYTPKTMFARWKRTVQTHRRYRNMRWIEGYHSKHLERWRRTGDPLHLAAALGMVAGLCGTTPSVQSGYDFRQEDSDWANVARMYFP